MKIPFDIKFKPQIESGEYRVETREGLPARIICWDRLAKKYNDADLNLCVLVPDDGGEAVFYYNRSGKRWVPNDDYDLFIITPEPELSEFEKELSRCLYDSNVRTGEEDYDKWAKEYAPALLNIARKELCEQIVDHTKDAYENGKAEALKDLPMWKKRNDYDYPTQLCGVVISGGQTTKLPVVIADGYEIPIPELLNKLPKEE